MKFNEEAEVKKKKDMRKVKSGVRVHQELRSAGDTGKNQEK